MDKLHETYVAEGKRKDYVERQCKNHERALYDELDEFVSYIWVAKQIERRKNYLRKKIGDHFNQFKRTCQDLIDEDQS